MILKSLKRVDEKPIAINTAIPRIETFFIPVIRVLGNRPLCLGLEAPRACLQGGRVTLGLGYPRKRVTLALAHFFFFSSHVYKAARVTLPQALFTCHIRASALLYSIGAFNTVTCCRFLEKRR